MTQAAYEALRKGPILRAAAKPDATAEEVKAWAEARYQDPPGAGRRRMKTILSEENEHELRHGTYLDYLAHKRRGEDPCPPALAAYNRARDREAALQRRTA